MQMTISNYASKIISQQHGQLINMSGNNIEAINSQ
jgi:hypothetical protein